MSLRSRLMLAVALVVLASIGAVAVVSSRVVRLELDQVLATRSSPNVPARRTTVAALTTHYRDHGWNEVQPVLIRMRDLHFRGKELLLLDGQDKVIAASTLPDGGLNLTRLPNGAIQLDFQSPGASGRLVMMGTDADVVMPEVGKVASVLVVPPWMGTASFTMRSVNRWLIAIVAAVGLVALVFTALLARSVVRPIEELQRAVGHIQSGDLGHRVSATSSDEIGRLAHAFNAMSEELARNEELRRNLVNDVAHELRTPLTNLRCAVEAVQDGLREPDTRLIESLHEDLVLLERLVDDLQTLSLAEAGKLPLHRETFELAELTRFPNDSRVRADVPPGFRVDADRQRFQQILGNLVRNAFTHGGQHVTITAAGTVIVVADDGPGIPVPDLPHIFDRFYRADPSRARASGGAGLGLAIVKELLDLHGATIQARNREGGGAEFRIELARPATVDAAFNARPAH